MSPLRSSAGPAVITNGTSSSAARICASDVLPSPGGPASSTWSSASPRAAAASSETASCSLSAGWPTNSSSRRGRSERSSSSSGVCSGVWMRAVTGSVMTCAPPSARWPSSSSARLAGGVGEQRLRLGGRVAELEQAVAGQQARVVAARGRGSPTVASAGDADLLAQLDDDPLGRALADPRHGLEAGRVARRERRDQVARRAAGQDGQRDLRARRTARRSAAGTGRAPPRWRSRRARSASSRTMRWACSVTRRPTAGTWRSVSAETLSR